MYKKKENISKDYADPQYYSTYTVALNSFGMADWRLTDNLKEVEIKAGEINLLPVRLSLSAAPPVCSDNSTHFYIFVYNALVDVYKTAENVRPLDISVGATNYSAISTLSNSSDVIKSLGINSLLKNYDSPMRRPRGICVVVAFYSARYIHKVCVLTE